MLLCLFSPKGFSAEKDTLNADTKSKVNIHRLPEDFKENYTSKDFVYEYDSENNGLTWSERISQWFYGILYRIFKLNPTQKGLQITSIVFKILYYIAVLAIIFFIVRSFLRKEGYWILGKKSDKLEIVSENIEIDLLETNFEALIKNSIINENYNLATRYYYLKTLKTLTEQGIIKWDTEKTNLDYLMEINDSKLQKQFQYISFIYDYCWYGEFKLNKDSYKEVENNFQSLLKHYK